MKKYAKSAADAADCSAMAKESVMGIDGIQRLFYVERKQFEKLRAELRRPPEFDEGLRKVLKNNLWLKENGKQ